MVVSGRTGPYAVVYCTIFDVFDIDKYCSIEIRVRGHLRSSKLVPFDSVSMVSY